MHLTLALLLLLTAAVAPSGSSACWRIAPSSQCANRSLLSLRPEDSGSPTFTACAQRCLFTSGCAFFQREPPDACLMVTAAEIAGLTPGACESGQLLTA
uniref:Apple domain-containing protein n=1 Tax=Macrostomum lignano TaxID=282301 RepID=A0A1I8H9F1_9PLAT